MVGEKEELFSSSIKHTGIFNFKEFYQFCFDWVTEQTGIGNLAETEYSEKVNGEAKDIDIVWKGSRKLTDYFKFEFEAKFKILGLKKAEIVRDGVKIKTNEGQVKLTAKGFLARDWQGQFEKNGMQKFFRSLYEKYIIQARVDQFEDVVIGKCDEFLSESKAFLDLEGRK